MTLKRKTSARAPSRVTLPANTLPPANRAMIVQSLAVGMGRALGIKLKKLSRRRLEAEMTVTGDHINRSGRINGGALMAFADVLGAMGTLANLPEGCRTTTLESKTNFFAAAKCETGGQSTAAAHRPHHHGVADHDQQPGWHEGGDRDPDPDRDSAQGSGVMREDRCGLSGSAAYGAAVTGPLRHLVTGDR